MESYGAKRSRPHVYEMCRTFAGGLVTLAGCAATKHARRVELSGFLQDLYPQMREGKGDGALRGREFFLRLLAASQTLLFRLVSRGPCDESRCLLFDDEMNAPVLLHTVVTVLETDGTILSIARRVEVD